MILLYIFFLSWSFASKRLHKNQLWIWPQVPSHRTGSSYHCMIHKTQWLNKYFTKIMQFFFSFLKHKTLGFPDFIQLLPPLSNIHCEYVDGEKIIMSKYSRWDEAPIIFPFVFVLWKSASQSFSAWTSCNPLGLLNQEQRQDCCGGGLSGNHSAVLMLVSSSLNSI